MMKKLADEWVSVLVDRIGELAIELTPAVEASKVGSIHEEHDGWGMDGRRLGFYHCSCGEPLVNFPPSEWKD